MKRIKIRLHFLAERPQCFKSGFETQDEGTVANNIGGGEGVGRRRPQNERYKINELYDKVNTRVFRPYA